MCGCIATVNKDLSGANGKVVLPIIGPQRPFVEVMKLDERSRVKPPKLLASFCPFCGESYDLAQSQTA